MKLRSVAELEPRDKRVFVRVDWNVTLGKALQVVDDTRIRRTKKTILDLVERGAKRVILGSHLGKAEEGRSIRPVVEYAEGVIGEKIEFCGASSSCKGIEGKIVMLENLRLNPGEDNNGEGYVEELVRQADCYVNEAFGVSHRRAASVVGIAKKLPSYAGYNLIEEVERLQTSIDDPERPLVIIMGGAKVEDKLKILELMSQKADKLLLGGKLANEYQQKGLVLGGKAEVLLPVEGDDILDIGERTREIYAREIRQAKTIIWNGPMGMVEDKEYKAGTHAIYEALMENEPAEVVVGGGDTLAAIRDEKHLERIDWISTGGGAMLKLIEKGTLPGLEVLKR